MRVPLVVSLACSLFASAASVAQPPGADNLPEDIVEISPDLFILLHRYGRLEDLGDMQLETLRRASEFAASRGGVVVPIAINYNPRIGRAFQYQFRVTSREQALALKPVLTESLVAVHNTGACAPEGNVAAALNSLDRSRQENLDLAAAPELPGVPGMDSPPAICLPGTLCNPSQLCLPGWQCSPGMPPVPETPVIPPTPPTPPTASLR